MTKQRTETPTAADDSRPTAMDALPLRHPLRTVSAVLVVLIALSIIWSLANNKRIQWHVVGEYLFAELTMRGLAVTLILTVVSMLVGIVGGVVLAVMRQSDNQVLRSVAGAYIWFFRGTPLLVQIIFWGFLGAIYPQLVLGVPFTDVQFFSAETSALITAPIAAILGLGLNEAAYAAEIVRSGLLAVDNGQREAAVAIGFSEGLVMRRIVLPQAMRVIIPPMGNEVINMLKTTALVSVIAGKDLLTNLQGVYSQTFQVVPLLVVASIWYLTATTLLSFVQQRLERRYGRGHEPAGRPARAKLNWRTRAH
jgi:polar amino acid transport system permease protein